MEKGQDSTDGHSLVPAQGQGQLLQAEMDLPASLGRLQYKCFRNMRRYRGILWVGACPALPALQGDAAGGNDSGRLGKEGFRATPCLLELARLT